MDALLDDPVFFEPYRRHFSAVLGRPSIPIETYLRMMFLKHRYGLGYESLCREVADSCTWTRFCRIPWENRVPYPSTLGKMTNGCGAGTIDALNDVVLSKANDARGRQDGPGPGRHDRGAGEREVSDRLALLVRSITLIVGLVTRIHRLGAARRTRVRDWRFAAGQRPDDLGPI